MSKFVVVVFPDETAAYEGQRAVKELDAEGNVTLYAMAVVAKDLSGSVSVRQAADGGPLGTTVGALTGGLVGLLGGPAVSAMGLAGGALFGGWADLYNLGISATFLADVGQALVPGTVALVAEVDEAWLTPLDARMEPLGGIVLREDRARVEDVIALREAEARKAELAQLRAEYAQAREERRERVQARVDAAQAKFEAAATRAEARLNQLQQETEAQLKALQEQAARAGAEAEERIEQRIAELRAEHERRSGLLKQAAALAREAIAS